ncbi:MAG: hypothetical protein ACM3OB_10880 [Acidobacteriota bacterium]
MPEVVAPAARPPAFAAALRRLAILAAVLLAAFHLILLAGLLAARITYRFDIEWMEGATLLEAARLAHGLPLHVAPSADFIPFPYTPLYPALVALASRLTGLAVGYPLGRAVSIAALALAAWSIFRAVRREHGERWEAWSALGILAAGFAVTGGWFDLARIDMLYLGLAVAGFGVLRARGERASGVALGALLLALAFFSKQTAAAFLAAGALAVVLVRARLLPLYLAVAGGGVGTGVLLLDGSSGGWFRRYAFEILAHHEVHRDVLLGGAWWFLLDRFWVVALLLAAAWAVRLWRRQSLRGLAFWTLFALTGAGASAVGASIQWAFKNAYLPGLLGAAVVAGVAAAAIRDGAPGDRTWAGWTWLVPAALALQLGLLVYDPRPFLPGENRAAAERFIAWIRSQPGEVLAPEHPFAAVQAGKPPTFHTMALGAVLEGGLAVPEDLRQALASQRYSTIVLDRAPAGYLDLYAHYKLAHLLPESTSPRALTGFDVRPRYVLVPKRAEPLPPGVVALIDFESGSWNGWMVEGQAFGAAPAGGPTRFQGPVGPFGGSFFASSDHPSPGTTGWAVSPEFILPSGRLRLLVGGTNAPDRVGAYLLVDGERRRSAAGSGSDELRPVEWDVPDLVGKKARLELVDDDPNGYLLVDDLWALPGGGARPPSL